MAGNEIQSVEVSFFVHATEDESRLVRAVSSFFSLSEPEVEALEGHFGNRISHVTFRVTREGAARLFSRIVALLSGEETVAILGDRGRNIDERGALYLRFSKQELLAGRLVLAENDPVRLKLKPRGYLKGDPATFYAARLGRHPH
ncbi:MAG: hypothetical protein E6K84_05590 [Thaumarchaeota archaeon]|nr:MAG: hypothetical protein E6K84_05590 [Nitrososphaerota archaeon]